MSDAANTDVETTQVVIWTERAPVDVGRYWAVNRQGEVVQVQVCEPEMPTKRPSMGQAGELIIRFQGLITRNFSSFSWWSPVLPPPPPSKRSAPAAFSGRGGPKVEAGDDTGKLSAMYCEHANECPVVCPCGSDCYCKAHSCRPNA